MVYEGMCTYMRACVGICGYSGDGDKGAAANELMSSELYHPCGGEGGKGWERGGESAERVGRRVWLRHREKVGRQW